MSFLKLTGFRNDDQVFGPPPGFEARDWQDEFGQKATEMMSAHTTGTLVTSLEVGVAGGKTIGVAWVSSHILNAKMASRVVYVAPNQVILADAIETFRSFGIHLVNWENGKYPHGEPAMSNGLGMTYASLNRNPDLQRKICRHIPTLLLLDEYHHLGDKFRWCGAARDAFEGHVKVVIPFSGTPWRTDKHELLFVKPSRIDGNTIIYASDYSYPLGRCIADKICRNPIFEFLGGEVEIPTFNGIETVDFKMSLNRKRSNLRLSGAVRQGTPSRTEMLSRLVGRIEGAPNKHKAIIFLGGNTKTDDPAKEDAQAHLPKELTDTFGIDRKRIVVVTSDDTKASRKIHEFNNSDANYLITIDMVSEGINIPKIDTAAFLSSVTAKLKTIQRVGRVLRGSGHALVLMFKDPRYFQVACDIEDEVKYYEALRMSDGPDEGDGAIAGRTRPRVPGSGPRGLSAFIDSISVHGHSHTHQEREQVRTLLEGAGIVADDDRICTTLELIDKGLFKIGDVA